MCGIAGYIIKENKKVRTNSLQNLCANLLTHLAIRGRDATGYAFVSSTTKRVHIAKAATEVSNFLNIPGHLLFMGKKAPFMPRTMLLHVRAATQGNPKNNKNNHPLYSKASGLCLIHNGWFINDEEVAKRNELKLDAEVDSEVYLKLIEKHLSKESSVMASIYEASKGICGSIACGMIQAGKPGELWLWHDQGSLELAETDFGYVFASTKSAIIKSLCESMHANDVSKFRLINIPKNTLMYLRSNDETIYSTNLDFPVPSMGNTSWWVYSEDNLSHRVRRRHNSEWIYEGE